MNLFRKGKFKLSSGGGTDFKIDCDALTDDDIDCIAFLISKSIKFHSVIGVPTGGLRLAKALQQYCTEDWKLTTLICDDVLTTGKSMEKIKAEQQYPCTGVVIFARGYCPSWIKAVFQMNSSCY